MSERQTIDQLLADARARIERLEPAEASAAIEAGALLVDTRSGEVRGETGVIPGAVHVPLSVLYWRLDPTSGHDDPALSDPTRQVILICAHGYSSSLAAATLRDLGFERATDVIGGFEAWQAAGLPVVSARPEPGDVLIAWARALARSDGSGGALEIMLGAIAETFRIGSAAIFAIDRVASRLELVASFGLGATAAAGLTAAVRDAGHPIARTVVDAVPTFDVVPTAPGGPALRSHLPLIVTRGGVERVVGVLALAYDEPIPTRTRPILEACADLAAIAIEREVDPAGG